jgi:hypothetical protein
MTVKRLKQRRLTIMKTLTRTLLCLVMLTLTCATLFAQNQRLPSIEITVASGVIHPNVRNDAGLKTIYSNLGSKTDTYDDSGGWIVSGPASGDGQEWVAMPFTPKANATVTQIQIAVQHNPARGNAEGFNLVLAADSAGLPGKSLHSWDRKTVPQFGTCCQLDTVKYAKGIKVKKGKQYWVVAQTDSKSTDTWDAWDFTWNESTGNQALNKGSGWQVVSETLNAFAVQGK